jgi:PAS domain S-box-containing protein
LSRRPPNRTADQRTSPSKRPRAPTPRRASDAALSLLRAAIEGLDENFLLCDAEDRIVLYNRRYIESVGDEPVIGQRFEDFLRGRVALGRFPAAAGREKEWVAERLALRRAATSSLEMQIGDRWHLVRDRRLADGATVTVGFEITERKHAERALAESESHLRAIFDQAAVGIALREIDGRWIQVNQKLCEILGYTREEMLATTAVELTPPEERDAAIAFNRRMARGELAGYTREKRYLRKDGSPVWVNITVSVARDPAGAPSHGVTVIEDISARKEAELLARAADTRLRSALENLGEMVCLTDAQDRIVLANRRFLEFNSRVAEFVQPGRRYDEHLHAGIALGLFPDAAGREEKWLAERMAMRRNPTGPVERRRQDGRWLMVDDQLLPDGGIISFGIEITARKNAEEALRRAHERLRIAVDASGVSFWDFNLADASVFVSGGWSALVGAPVGDSRAGIEELLALLHPEDLPAMRSAFSSALRNDRIEYAVEHRVKTRAQEWRWVLSRGRVSERDASGRALRMIGTFVDITDRRRAEDLLRDVNAELERRVSERTVALQTAYRELESFSYSVSHDLRAPLRAISGYSNILNREEGERLSAQGRLYLAAMDESAKRMGRLTDALLALMRTSRQALCRTPLDMTSIVQTVGAELSRGHPAARVEVGPLTPANGDETLVRQVFANLIDNALKYSARHPAPRVEVGVDSDARPPTYYVRDNGVGFDMAYAGGLFRPFERLHSDKEFQGTGIGLALAHLIVQRHGGRLWAEAAPDKGATFRFTLDPGPGS